MIHKYILLGDPLPLNRARVNWNTRSVFDSQKKEKLKARITLEGQREDKPILEGPLKVNVVFYLSIAKKRERFIKEDTPHAQKPDLDNLIKYISDVMNDIIFKDDCLITDIAASKKYSKFPRTEITIEDNK